MSKIKATDAAILSEKLDLAVFDYGIPLFFNEAEGELVAKISSNYSFVIEKISHDFYRLSVLSDASKTKVYLRCYEEIGDIVDSVKIFFGIENYKFDVIEFIPLLKKYEQLTVIDGDNNNIIISSTLKNQRRISIECLHPGKYKISYRRPTDEPREWRRDTVSGENNINGLISELAKE